MYKIIIFCLFISSIVFSGCGKKETDPKQILAGEKSKIWKAEKETNAEGDKEKLTKEEKDEILQFYSNGTFSMNGAAAAAQGTWNYEEAAKNLSLKFNGTEVTENFSVLSMDDDNIELKAADGSTLSLESENE